MWGFLRWNVRVLTVKCEVSYGGKLFRGRELWDLLRSKCERYYGKLTERLLGNRKNSSENLKFPCKGKQLYTTLWKTCPTVDFWRSHAIFSQMWVLLRWWSRRKGEFCYGGRFFFARKVSFITVFRKIFPLPGFFFSQKCIEMWEILRFWELLEENGRKQEIFAKNGTNIPKNALDKGWFRNACSNSTVGNVSFFTVCTM